MCFGLPCTLLGGSTCLVCLLLSRFPDILSVPKPQGPHISCLNDLIGVSPHSAPAPTARFELGECPCFFLKENFPQKIFFLPLVFYIFQVGKGLKSHDTNYSSFLQKILHRLVQYLILDFLISGILVSLLKLPFLYLIIDTYA